MVAKLPFSKQQEKILLKETNKIEKLIAECENEDTQNYINLFEYVLQTKYALVRNVKIRKSIRQLAYKTQLNELFEKVMMFIFDATNHYYYVKV